MKSSSKSTQDRSNWTEQQWEDYEQEQERKYKERRSFYIVAAGFVWAISYLFFEHFWNSLAVDILRAIAGLFLLIGVVFGVMWLWDKLRRLKGNRGGSSS